jgi:hypothetical protein
MDQPTARKGSAVNQPFVLVLEDEYPEIVGITESGVRDTTDYDELVAEAQQRWARECEMQARVRAEEIARNSWHTYPGMD